MLKYIELKTGFQDNGAAWIGRVKESKSGRTLYFNGRALKRGVRGTGGNYFDLKTGEIFWISGVKLSSQDRHWAGSGKVLIEAAAVEEYLSIIGQPELDPSRFVVTNEIKETDPADFNGIENRHSVGCGLITQGSLSRQLFGPASARCVTYVVAPLSL